MKTFLAKHHHVIWYDNDHRKVIMTDDARELEMIMKTTERVPVSINDFVLKVPIRVESYWSLKELLEEDMKLWRKLNS